MATDKGRQTTLQWALEQMAEAERLAAAAGITDIQPVDPGQVSVGTALERAKVLRLRMDRETD